jgi:heat shock protein HtpX
MLKRIFLFLSLNILIIASVSLLSEIFGLKPYMTHAGIDIQALAMFCLVWGCTGSLISLLLSKRMAKWMLSLKIIDPNQRMNPLEERVFTIVKKLSIKQQLLSIPEVGIWRSQQSNAFATGASKNSSLIAVSSTLLETLSERELEGVIAHEMAHITNGDMVTMALLQGLINSFVMFLSRICAYGLNNALSKNDKKGSSYFSNMLFTVFFEMIFLSLGSLLLFFVSRKREFAADYGGAQLVGKEKMIEALQSLERHSHISKAEYESQKGLAAMMISSTKRVSLSKLFSTHPTIKERIASLESYSENSWKIEQEMRT